MSLMLQTPLILPQCSLGIDFLKVLLGRVYFEKIRVFKTALWLYIIAWNNN